MKDKDAYYVLGNRKIFRNVYGDRKSYIVEKFK